MILDLGVFLKQICELMIGVGSGVFIRQGNGW